MAVIWLLLACTQPQDTGSASASAVDTGAETVAYRNPAEAEDLDPAEGAVQVSLTAAAHAYEVLGRTVDGYAYNGQVPGPTLRVTRGDTLTVDLDNQLDVPTTIHWHGLHVPYAMDGVTWSTDPVMPGESFTYAFTVDQPAGTYWYHPHFDTVGQVDAGLYGVVIVEDPDEPEADEEWVWVLDDWEASLDTASSDTENGRHGGGDHQLPELGGRSWTVNGLSLPTLTPSAGSKVRVRLLNASNNGYAAPAYPGMRHIGSDQGLLPALAQPDSVVLAPGDRADLELLVGDGTWDLAFEPWTLVGVPAYEEPDVVLTIAPQGEGAAPDGLDWPFPGGTVSEDPGHTDIVLTFQGDLHADEWLINGETFPDVTVPALALDQEAVLEVRNLSPSRHPFHIHGHAFEVLSVDGVAPEHPVVEDTYDVAMHSVLRVRMVANNPGSWMTHCHILEHADGGMMTVIEVE